MKSQINSIDQYFETFDEFLIVWNGVSETHPPVFIAEGGTVPSQTFSNEMMIFCGISEEVKICTENEDNTKLNSIWLNQIYAENHNLPIVSCLRQTATVFSYIYVSNALH